MPEQRLNAAIRFFLSLYVFFLPYLKVGIPVVHYRVTLSDIFLMAAGAVIAGRVLKRRELCVGKEYLPVLAAVSFFIISLIPSGLKSHSALEFLLEIAPYLSAFVAVFVFSALFSFDRAAQLKGFIKIYLASFFISTMPALLSFIWNSRGPFLRFFYNDAEKYQFFCITPNQYTFYAITAILMTFVYDKIHETVRFCILLSGAVVIFMSGSRTGSVLLLFLGVYCIGRFIVHLCQRRLSKQTVYLSILTLAIFFVVIVPFVHNRFWNTGRSLSGITHVFSGKFGDEYRQLQLGQSLQQFVTSPLVGIGLGNFMKVAPDGHEIHNSFLSILAEAGIIGFIGFFGFNLVLLLLVLGGIRPLGDKINGLVILAVPALYMAGHHIFRERWLWLLYVFLTVYFSARSKEKA